MPTHAYTIAKLAKGAGVNVETVRYYQRRGLLDEPIRVDGGFREYDERHLERLLFIKRAQELGFTLDDAAELSSLSQSNDRRHLRDVALTRAADIRRRIAQLESMAAALDTLAETCKRTSPNETCPIVAALHGCCADGENVGVGARRTKTA
jgi:MerR family mercuric resistance operon transcriptional regulator